MCCVGTRRRRERREIREGREAERSPEEALARAVVACARAWRVGEVRAENPAAGVADDEHETGALAPVLRSEVVERGERAAVLLERVDQLPGVGELQAGRHEEADLFCDGFAEEARGDWCAIFVAGEGQGSQRRRLEGREAPRGRVEDCGLHGAVVVCAEGAGEGCWGVVGGEAAADSGEGVGDGLDEVAEG